MIFLINECKFYLFGLIIFFSDSEVYYYEIKDWLCDVPTNLSASSKKDINKEKKLLDTRTADAAFEELQSLKEILVSKNCTC